ncbi:MAG: septum formation protein Maf [Opitutae bacterium]|jgi:septum formation protein|nr:septum formation protein Maf [Opitutae bacterium]
MNRSDSHPLELILASASPRRSELLERIGLRFRICPADIVEYNSADDGPAQMVLHNAGLKADALTTDFPGALVLGSDTTVAFDGIVLNKPVDLDDARSMLQQLSGRPHTVYTSIALRWQAGGLSDDFVEASQVHFKTLDDATISAYFQCVDPLDKAGAYGIQTGREMIVEAVEGSVENVMGLPIQALEARLFELGFDFRV